MDAQRDAALFVFVVFVGLAVPVSEGTLETELLFFAGVTVGALAVRTCRLAAKRVGRTPARDAVSTPVAHR